MALSNLEDATRGGDLSGGQDTKETTSDDRDNLISDSIHAPFDLDVSAGGTFDLSTPQGNIDSYRGAGLIRLTGSAASAVTVIVPDGNKRGAFANVCGQPSTIDTVTGATPTVAIPDGVVKTLHVRGIEIEIVADDASETGALLADGSVPVTGDFNWLDKILQRPELKDYSETSSGPSSAGGTITLDIEDGNAVEVTLTESTIFTFSNPSPTGKACSFSLLLKQDGTGGWVSTWPGTVKWAGGGSPDPTVAPDGEDWFSFITIDAGTIWYGFVGGLNFS